jgi:DNA-binding NarL/FixJ family response regulator
MNPSWRPARRFRVSMAQPAVTDGSPVTCRVFIADDVEAIRTLWRHALAEHDQIEVVGDAADGQAAIDGVRATRPDVLVLDLSMPRVDGLEVIRALRDDGSDTRVVVASGFLAGRMAALVLELGAVGYFEKGSPVGDLCETVLGACDADGCSNEHAAPPGA